MDLKFKVDVPELLKVAAAVVLLAVCPDTANAHNLMLPLDAQLSRAIMTMLGSGSYCITFTYDLNGNRTAQTVSTLGSSSTLWGAKPFGCFVWAP